MKPILIIKAGTTLPELKATVGDFDDWIVTGTGMTRSSFIVTSVFENVPLPQPDYISAVIISGSHSNVTENLPWMKQANRWLLKAAHKNIPVLGICFGHQIIARTFGGIVDYNPAGWELGLLPIKQKNKIKPDPLFSVLPHNFNAFVSHKQSVIKLPQGAEVLASSEKEAVQAFRIQQNIWGIQFHPEFTTSITKTYLDFHRAELLAEGENPPARLTAHSQKEWGPVVLKQFVKIVENS